MDHPLHIAISAGLAITAMAIVGVYVLTTISGSTGAADILIQSAQAVVSRDGVQISLRLENTGPAPVTKVVPIMSIDGKHTLLEVDGLPAEQYRQILIRGEVSGRDHAYDNPDYMIKFAETVFRADLLAPGGDTSRVHPKMARIHEIYPTIVGPSPAEKNAQFAAIPNDEKISILSKKIKDDVIHSDLINEISRMESRSGADIPIRFNQCIAPTPYDAERYMSDCSLRQYPEQTYPTGKKFTITAVMETASGEKIEKLIQMRIS